MFFVLIFGLVGFVTYFTFNYIILNQNRDSLEKVVSSQIPALEKAHELIIRIEAIQSLVPQLVVSQNVEVLNSVEKADAEAKQIFKAWAGQSLPFTQDIQDIGVKYNEGYRQLSDVVTNIVAGVSTLAAQQGVYKDALSKVAATSASMKVLKLKIDEDLQKSVAHANLLGRSAVFVGAGLLACAVIITALFFLVMANIVQSLTGANGTLQATSRRLLEMVEEAQVSSSQLRDTSNRQASSSTETVVSMEQMKRLLSQTSKTSTMAVEMSESSIHEANDGKTIVQSLLDAMAVIEKSNEGLEEVTQVVRLIRDRTNVINEIVFKTQMLSFNANIEAARAGQHGLGFAVVANEMGNLAEMSGKAAQQINELLDKSTHQVENTILSTKEKISNANELSLKCFEFFKQLTDRSGELKKMVDSISSASAEQNSGVEYVVNAMNDLNNTAAETDRMAQGISTLADSLKDQATGLASAVESLAILVNGDSTGDNTDDDGLPGAKSNKSGDNRLTLVKESA